MDLVLNSNLQVIDSDQELIHQIAAGKSASNKSEALRRLFDAYGPKLYAYALRITGDPANAEEAVQESLIAVWQGAGKFRGESRAIAWLLGIIHHKALNLLRGRTIETLDEETQALLDSKEQPDEQAEVSEQRRLVQTGLERLSMEHRQVLELVFYQGLSLAEAAEVCDCPVGTIKSRLNYAKLSLRGALDRAGLCAEDLEV